MVDLTLLKCNSCFVKCNMALCHVCVLATMSVTGMVDLINGSVKTFRYNGLETNSSLFNDISCLILNFKYI